MASAFAGFFLPWFLPPAFLPLQTVTVHYEQRGTTLWGFLCHFTHCTQEGIWWWGRNDLLPLILFSVLPIDLNATRGWRGQGRRGSQLPFPFLLPILNLRSLHVMSHFFSPLPSQSFHL